MHPALLLSIDQGTPCRNVGKASAILVSEAEADLAPGAQPRRHPWKAQKAGSWATCICCQPLQRAEAAACCLHVVPPIAPAPTCMEKKILQHLHSLPNALPENS